MFLVIYFIHGFLLFWYLLSPPYRHKVNARRKMMRHPAVVREVTTGIVGLVIICGLLFVLIIRLTS